MKLKFRMLLDSIKQTFQYPTIKQKEAYGRFCHTLAAAALAGSLTVLHLDNKQTAFIAARFMVLLVSAVVLFVIGAMLSKGE